MCGRLMKYNLDITMVKLGNYVGPCDVGEVTECKWIKSKPPCPLVVTNQLLDCVTHHVSSVKIFDEICS